MPGGATIALSNSTTLYVAGQQLLADGMFTGVLSTINLASNTVTGSYSISDGTHTKLLFADDNTLWIGSQFCATGERALLNENYNCLTRFDLGALTAQLIPNVTPRRRNHGRLPERESESVLLRRSDWALLGAEPAQGLHRIRRAGPRVQHHRRFRDQQRD